MRKRELVHLHALLSRTRGFVDRREAVPEATFERYDELSVAPQAVYESKGAHEEAVMALASALADAVDADDAVEAIDDAGDERPLGATTD